MSLKVFEVAIPFLENPGCLYVDQSQYCLPGMDCSRCGERNYRKPVWCPSWSVPEEYLLKPDLPGVLDVAVSSEEFFGKIAPKVGGLKAGDRLVPGAYVGLRPIKIAKRVPRELSLARLKKHPPLIQWNMVSLFSEKAFEVLSHDPAAHFSRIAIEAGTDTYPYYVFDSPFREVWSDEEHRQKGISRCPVCGILSFKVLSGTYRKKTYRHELFEGGPRVHQALENNTVTINEPMKELLEKALPGRLRIQEYGLTV
jgi:hypothetical protein